MSGENWVRAEIVQALTQGYSTNSEESCVQNQADAIMTRLHRIAEDADTFHTFVGYLNSIRLDAMRIERAEREGGDNEASPREGGDEEEIEERKDA